VSDTDLSLIPIADLLDAVEKRCHEFICAFTPIDFEKKKEQMFKYGKGSWHISCGLANVLNNDVLNNWNNELETLQRIHNEGIL
jgi:hypothetical protein